MRDGHLIKPGFIGANSQAVHNVIAGVFLEFYSLKFDTFTCGGDYSLVDEILDF